MPRRRAPTPRRAILGACQHRTCPSTASTASSPPAASAPACGRSPAPTPRSSCTTSRAPARRCCKDTWDRLAPLSGEQRVMVVTGRAAPRRRRGAAARRSPTRTSCSRASPRDSTAAIGLAAAILERREPGVVDRLVRRRPRDLGRRAVPRRRGRRGRGRARRVHRHDRHHAHRARRGLRVHRVRRHRWTVDGRRARRGGVELRREARPRDGEAATSRAATTSGTRACSSRRRRPCSRSWRARSPSCTPACSSSPRPGTTPRRAARRSTASGRRSRRSPSTTPSRSPPPRPAGSPSSAGTSSGTTWATSPRSPSSTPPGAPASSRSSARTRGCSPTRRAASS